MAHDTFENHPLIRNLTWKRHGDGWRLFSGGRRFGDVVPDAKHTGMWRMRANDDAARRGHIGIGGRCPG